MASSPGTAGLPDSLEEHIDEDLAAGTQVGEYLVEGKLGEGGFGTVYRARHPLIGKMAAIKVLAREYSSNREMVSRFVAEARSVNTIRHGNIIDIFSFGTLEDGRHYFVMELLDGGTLDQFLDDGGPMAPPLALAVLRGIAGALDAAHDSGIIHRDLKPENVFLTFGDEGRPVPKLLDFGIAKLSGDAKAISGHKTRTGAPIGTPQYMSPEQCIGHEVDERSDVYAFAVLAFELLAGEPPFTDTSLLGLMNKQATAPRPKLSSANAQVGACFDVAIQTIMAIDPDARPKRAGEAWQLLADAAREGGHALQAPVTVPIESRQPGKVLGSAATQPVDSLATDTKHPATRTLREDEAKAPPTRWGWVAAAVVVAAVVVAAAAGTSSSPAPAASPAASEPNPRPSAAATASAAAIASVAISASAPSPADAPTTLTIRVESSAPDAVAYVDGERLGPTPGPFEIAARGDEARQILVKAPGHRDATLSRVLADGDRVVVEPQPLAPSRPVPGGKVDGDLEDPYH